MSVAGASTAATVAASRRVAAGFLARPFRHIVGRAVCSVVGAFSFFRNRTCSLAVFFFPRSSAVSSSVTLDLLPLFVLGITGSTIVFLRRLLVNGAARFA